MCGIVGFVTRDISRKAGALGPMIDALHHRGPDDRGSWVDFEAGVGLGMTRLAILDLSPLGHQPMFSASGRYVIVFNGEVFNFAEIRSELLTRGHSFKGHSDTEVILASLEEWTLEEALSRFAGMFALALWDRRERELTLVRDRIGIKPLYYGWVPGAFVFASELSSFSRFPSFESDLDRDSIALLLRTLYIPAPHSIYRGVYKLWPGSFIRLGLAELLGEVSLDFSPFPLGGSYRQKPRQFWSALKVAEGGRANRFVGSEREAQEQLENLLREAVRLRMISDVPLGAFLSGGVDPSTVVAMMQAQSAKPVRTFTIGFHEPGYNEALYAKQVARHLGTEHTELYVLPQDVLEVVPLLPTMFDEPFADSSQIPTFLVSKLARQHVTVSLSGDGDELFGGYDRYRRGLRVWQAMGLLPVAIRQWLAGLLLKLDTADWNIALEKLKPLCSGLRDIAYPGDKVHRLAYWLGAESRQDFYARLVSVQDDPCKLVLGASPSSKVFDSSAYSLKSGNFVEGMMYLDLVSYLVDDILVKVDRASMAVSLEARVPLLDHRLVEFVWCLPLELRTRPGRSKWLLRKILYDYVPKELVERPKMGFAVPIREWLRAELREWAEALLAPERIRREGFLDAARVSEMWRAHLSGRKNLEHQLWSLLMFQGWLEARAAGALSLECGISSTQSDIAQAAGQL